MCRACIEGKRWKKEELWGVEEEGNGVGKKGGRGEGRGNGSMEEGYPIRREGWESGKNECRG